MDPYGYGPYGIHIDFEFDSRFACDSICVLSVYMYVPSLKLT